MTAASGSGDEAQILTERRVDNVFCPMRVL
jgi:hypothetical protein